MPTTPANADAPDLRPPAPAIAAAQAAARAARAWSVQAAGDTALDATPHPTIETQPPSPDTSWCTRPPTPDESAAADQRRREAETAAEIRRYGSVLVAHAWFAADPADPDASPPPQLPTLSPAARTRARGIVQTGWQTGRYRGRRAYVCLDCDWVGQTVPMFAGPVVPDAAEADTHQCPAARP